MGRIRKLLHISIIKTIYFNFKYLPFNQAIHLPILLFSPKFLRLGGSISLECSKVSFGMVQMGYAMIPLFPKDGVILQIGGHLCFKGKCVIGNKTAISTGDNSQVIFGDNTSFNSSLTIICKEKIEIGKDVLGSWNIEMMDTPQHCMKDINTGEKVTKPSKPIIIGDNCWIAAHSSFLPGARIAKKTTASYGTLITKDMTHEGEGVVFGGNPAKVIKRNVFLDRNDAKWA